MRTPGSLSCTQVRDRIVHIVQEAVGTLGHEPRLILRGPLEIALAEATVDLGLMRS